MGLWNDLFVTGTPPDSRRPPGPADGDGVSIVELFFDLVFVFTITQLSRLVADDPSASGVARAALIFGNLWWMYGGYAWLTNAAQPRRTGQRVFLLVGMAGFLVASLGIPAGFGTGGIALGVGYLVVTVVHGAMLLGPMDGSFLRAMGWLGPLNLATALLLLAAGFAGGWLQWSLWVAAFLLHWTTPYLTRPETVALRSRHFVERHGLIVLIALGESVVAISLGSDRIGVPAGLAVTAVVALAAVASLWWLYFDGDDAAAEQALAAASDDQRAWLALHVYGYLFVVLLGGIVIFAAGMRRSIVAYDRPVSAGTAALIAGGAAAYLTALAAIRWRLRIGSPWLRLILAVAVIPTILVGRLVSPLAQLTVLACLLGGGIALEHGGRPEPGQVQAGR